MEGLCPVSLSYLQSWSAPLSPCLAFLHRTRNLGFMKFVVLCRKEPQNFQYCFPFKKPLKRAVTATTCAPDTSSGWLLEGSQHNPPVLLSAPEPNW